MDINVKKLHKDVLGTRKTIVKIDELTVKMEEIYDNFNDGIWVVEECMEDNRDFTLNFSNDTAVKWSGHCGHSG
jgi:hypothetical protein